MQGEIVRLEQHTVDLADENAALRAESDRLEARDAALQGYGLDDMHNDQLSQLILTLTQVWAGNPSTVTGDAKTRAACTRQALCLGTMHMLDMLGMPGKHCAACLGRPGLVS